MPRSLNSSLMKPLVVLALPGMYLAYKITEYKRQQQENKRRKVTERELAHLNHKIDKLLTRLEENEPELATSQDEECVICISAKATMQTYPCGHRVVCRKCFVKTIQMTVSQRLLPLRCVICRTKILRLKQSGPGSNCPAPTPVPPGTIASLPFARVPITRIPPLHEEPAKCVLHKHNRREHATAQTSTSEEPVEAVARATATAAAAAPSGRVLPATTVPSGSNGGSTHRIPSRPSMLFTIQEKEEAAATAEDPWSAAAIRRELEPASWNRTSAGSKSVHSPAVSLSSSASRPLVHPTELSSSKNCTVQAEIHPVPNRTGRKSWRASSAKSEVWVQDSSSDSLDDSPIRPELPRRVCAEVYGDPWMQATKSSPVREQGVVPEPIRNSSKLSPSRVQRPAVLQTKPAKDQSIVDEPGRTPVSTQKPALELDELRKVLDETPPTAQLPPESNAEDSSPSMPKESTVNPAEPAFKLFSDPVPKAEEAAPIRLKSTPEPKTPLTSKPAAKLSPVYIDPEPFRLLTSSSKPVTKTDVEDPNPFRYVLPEPPRKPASRLNLKSRFGSGRRLSLKKADSYKNAQIRVDVVRVSTSPIRSSPIRYPVCQALADAIGDPWRGSPSRTKVFPTTFEISEVWSDASSLSKPLLSSPQNSPGRQAKAKSKISALSPLAGLQQLRNKSPLKALRLKHS